MKFYKDGKPDFDLEKAVKKAGNAKLSAAERAVFAAWLTDKPEFSAAPSVIADRLGKSTKSAINNAQRALKSMVAKGVLTPGVIKNKVQQYAVSEALLAEAQASLTATVNKTFTKTEQTSSSTSNSGVVTSPVFSNDAVLSPISNYGQLDAATLQILNEVSQQKTLQFNLTATQKKDLESFNEKVTQFQEVKDFPLPYCVGGDLSDLEMNILNKVMEVSAVDIEWDNGRPNSLNALVRYAMEKICDNTQSYARYFFRDGKMPDKNPPVLFAFQLQNNHQLISFVSNVLQKHFQPTVQKYAEGWNKKIYAEVAEFAAMPAFPAHKHPDVVDKENEKNDLAFLKQAIKESENSFFECQAFTILKYKHRANLLSQKDLESFNDLLPKAEKFMANRQAEIDAATPTVMSPEAEAAYNLLYGAPPAAVKVETILIKEEEKCLATLANS